MNQQGEHTGAHWRALWPLFLVFLAVPCLIELYLTAADLGLVATTRLRATFYQHGAFWSGLLDNWRPNYPAQPWMMFLTYSFLHAELWHLVGNMIAFAALTLLIGQRLATGWLVLLYLLSAIGGAIGFAFLGTVVNPMVGASGALFGLTAAWRWMEWRMHRDSRESLVILVRDVSAVAILNLVMWLAQDGVLAWEAHLGGFLTGLVVMALFENAGIIRERTAR